MSRKSKWIVGAVALALVGRAGNAGALTAAAGNVSCVWTGKAIIRPAVVFGGTATSASVLFKGKLSSCTGPQEGGVVVTGGSIKMAGITTSNDCLALVEGIPPLTATIRWRVAPRTPRVLPSTVIFNGGGLILGSAVTISIPGYGASFVTGSFAGDIASITLITDQLTSAFTAGCSAAKGVNGLTFTGLNGPSTVSLSCGCIPSTTTTSTTTTTTTTPDCKLLLCTCRDGAPCAGSECGNPNADCAIIQKACADDCSGLHGGAGNCATTPCVACGTGLPCQ